MPVRLDAILAGRPAVLTARRPGAGLADFCRRHGLVLARISAPGTGTPPRPGAQQDAGWIDVRLVGDAAPAGMRALVADPALTVLVRPDRVVAAVGTRSRLPRLPWYIPAAIGPERPATAPRPLIPNPSLPSRPPLGVPHVRDHFAAAGRGLPAPRGRQTDGPAQDAAIRRALRHPLAPLPAHRRSRTSRRRRHPDRPVVASPRPGRGGRDGPAAARRHHHHRKAADSAQEVAPAVLALLLTVAYMAIALIG
ncbi:MAG TPA: hypothetical protein VF933_03565 [Streptosporangiaceae bacterium]